MMLTTEYVDDFKEFYEANKEHLEKHYKDFAETYSGTIALDLDIDLFQRLIDAGSSNIFCLKDDDTFVGYISVTISPSLLFKGTVDAIIDHFYLTEDSRGKGYAKSLLSDIEKQLCKDGLDNIKLALPSSGSYDKLAKTLGYRSQSSVYIKDLGERDGS